MLLSRLKRMSALRNRLKRSAGKSLAVARLKRRRRFCPAPATPEAGVAVAAPEELTRKHAFRTALFDERQRTADFYGKQYDAWEKTHGDKIVTDTGDIAKLAAIGEPGSAYDRLATEPSPGLRKLPLRASGLAPAKAVRDEAGGLIRAEGPTVTTIRDLRKQAQAFRSGSDVEKGIADDIADYADKLLESAQGLGKDDVAQIRDLNRNYRDFKETYKSAFLKHVSNEPEPVNVAKDIFDVPKRAERLLTAATPEERATYRNLMADWMNAENVPLHEIPAKIGDDNLRRLGFNPDDMKQFEPKLVELKTNIAKSPTVARDINTGVRERMTEIHADMGDKLRKETIQLARQLGPAGTQIETAARNALTPMDVQKVAGQLAQMKSEDFVKALAAQQMTGPDAALRAVSKVPLKGDAARQALLRMKPGRIESYAGRFLAFHTLYWGLRSMDGLITGAGGMHGVIGMAALDALAGGYMGLRATGRAMLKKPELFNAIYKAIDTPGKLGGYQKTGRAIAEVLKRRGGDQREEYGGQGRQDETSRGGITMKRTYIMATLLVLVATGFALGETATQYLCYTVSVNSASVPVGILPPNPPSKPAAWSINERAANASATPAAANVLVFPYTGAVVPTGVPSACASPTTTLTNTGCYEVTPTKPLSDAVTCDQPSCVGPIGQAWGAILESGSTAVTVDSCER